MENIACRPESIHSSLLVVLYILCIARVKSFNVFGAEIC